MKTSIWENPEFLEEYNKNYNKINKGLESLIEKECRKLEKAIKIIDIDSDTIDYDEGRLKVKYSEESQVELPIGFLNCTYEQFDYMMSTIYQRLSTEDKNQIIERSSSYFDGLEPQILERGLEDLMTKNNVNGINYKRVFYTQLQNGFYDVTYENEEKITNELNTNIYNDKIQTNNKRAKKHRKIIESKDFIAKKNKIPEGGMIGISKRETIHYDLSDCSSYDSEYEENIEKPSHKTSTIDKPEIVENMSISQSSRRNKKAIKKSNYSTVLPSTNEELMDFRRQEIERYRNPTIPYIYRLKNGEERIVAPACKKLSDSTAKARDHYLLRAERPSVVTLLSLARDAAAKLPNGFGTRNDICELLKASQFINTDVSEEKMSSVVSGALDRLHYEKDPCVKYDSDKKLWFYLHLSRTKEDFMEDVKKDSGHGKKVSNDRRKNS